MKRSRPPRPAVWEPPGRLGMSLERTSAHGAIETPPAVISPRPGDGRDQGLHSLPEEAQPGTVPRPPPRYPRASQPRLAPGEY